MKKINYKSNKSSKHSIRAFTLIELLAVIAILAIVMVIAVPTVLNTIATAKKGAFITETNVFVKAAINAYSYKSIDENPDTCFTIQWLKENNYVDKNIDAYSGTITINKEDTSKSIVAISNGSLAITVDKLSDLKVVNVKDETKVNNDCSTNITNTDKSDFIRDTNLIIKEVARLQSLVPGYFTCWSNLIITDELYYGKYPTNLDKNLLDKYSFSTDYSKNTDPSKVVISITDGVYYVDRKISSQITIDSIQSSPPASFGTGLRKSCSWTGIQP